MTEVDCSKVYVKHINQMKGYGAFAAEDIQKGQLVEKGLMKVIDTDGNNNPYLFTWSEDRTKWAYPTGCATYYNTAKESNCEMRRDFETDVFEIYALRDIGKDEELTHLYKSLEWRTAFQGLKTSIHQTYF